MVSSEKEYPGSKRGRIFQFALMVGILGVFFFQLEILEAMGRQPRIDPGINFILGGLFAVVGFYFINSLLKASIRICDHFLTDNFDQVVLRWSQIKSVAVEGNSLALHMPKARIRKKYHIPLSYVPDREEFMKEIKRICEIRGIPFKEQQ